MWIFATDQERIVVQTRKWETITDGEVSEIREDISKNTVSSIPQQASEWLKEDAGGRLYATRKAAPASTPP